MRAKHSLAATVRARNEDEGSLAGPRNEAGRGEDHIADAGKMIGEAHSAGATPRSEAANDNSSFGFIPLEGWTHISEPVAEVLEKAGRHAALRKDAL